MGKVATAKAEDKIHPLLQKHKLALPIEVSLLDGDLVAGYPRLKPLHFLEYMAESGNIHRLLGGKSIWSCGQMLEQFWKDYELCHPDFGFFLDSDVDRSCCIPIYAHADGGRGFKKSELMVFNWSSVIGSGTGKGNNKDHSVKSRLLRKKRNATKDSAQINLLGHSYTTHYLWAVMPAAWHKDDSVFQSMLAEFGRDLAECFEKGVEVQGKHFRLVLLGLKADLKLQARAGRFNRWYSTCRKGPMILPKTKQQDCVAGCAGQAVLASLLRRWTLRLRLGTRLSVSGLTRHLGLRGPSVVWWPLPLGTILNLLSSSCQTCFISIWQVLVKITQLPVWYTCLGLLFQEQVWSNNWPA